jgi:hypothetical protein
MKNAIVQIYVDLKGYSNPEWLPKHDELSKISFNLTKKYCQKINAEYFLITDARINHIHPTYERFTLFEDSSWTEKFDQILYLDSDVFVYNNAPNIFEMYPDLNNFKVCQHWDEYRFKHKGVLPGTVAFNAGVFILTKYSRDIMLPFLNYKKNPPYKFHDNEALVECVKRSNVSVQTMDVMFNAKNWPDAYFCHAWGGGKRRNPNMPCIEKAKKEIKNVNN